MSRQEDPIALEEFVLGRIHKNHYDAWLDVRTGRFPMSRCWSLLVCCGLLAVQPGIAAETATRSSPTYQPIKSYLNAVPAIDTHDHLWPFDKLPGYVETAHGRGMNLASLWRNSYYTWNHPLTPWQPGGNFDDWWAKAKHDFADARA